MSDGICRTAIYICDESESHQGNKRLRWVRIVKFLNFEDVDTEIFVLEVSCVVFDRSLQLVS